MATVQLYQRQFNNSTVNSVSSHISPEACRNDWNYLVIDLSSRLDSILSRGEKKENRKKKIHPRRFAFDQTIDWPESGRVPLGPFAKLS